jgi:hypothetical protein
MIFTRASIVSYALLALRMAGEVVVATADHRPCDTVEQDGLGRVSNDATQANHASSRGMGDDRVHHRGLAHVRVAGEHVSVPRTISILSSRQSMPVDIPRSGGASGKSLML